MILSLTADRKTSHARIATTFGLAALWSGQAAFAQLCVPDLTADANGDCVVDPLDSGYVLARLGCSVGTGNFDCDSSDTNGDGLVDPLDLGYLLARFCGGGNLPTVAIDPPVPLTKSLTVHLQGTSIRATQVEVAGGTQLVTVDVGQCTWEANVGLVQDQVNFLYVTAISGDGVRGTPVPITVTNDTKHPDLFIDFPPDDAELTTETTDVAGRVSDTLSGFVGLSVNVNRLPAEVDVGIGTNGTFFLAGLPLEVGDNLITATGADVLGNMITKSITVTRVEVSEDASVMTVLFGNGQSGTVHSYLPLPIVVQVTGGNGKPIAGKLVTFDVARSDGRLSDQPSGEGSLMFQTFTDDEGKAMAFWLLGGTAGAGSDRVSATSNGIIGSAFLCASATAGPPHHINVGSGNNLRAEVNSPAPEPLRIWVNDQCNGVADLPITFTVLRGDGLVNGQSSVTIPTDITGHAEVNFILGPDPGKNSVEATFAGNNFPPVLFAIYGLQRAEIGITSFSGVIFDNASRPLGSAGVQLLITGQEAGLAVTDVDGRFEIDFIAFSGEADVYIDGDTINTITGQPVPANVRFPDLHYNTQIIDGVANSLPAPILLPLLDTVNDRVYFGDQTTDLELTCQGIEGLKMIVKAGTTITLPDGTEVGPNQPGSSVTLGLNQVHDEDVPMPMTDGAAPPFAWTLQPAGTKFDPPVEVEYPNMTGLPAGAISNFLSFNHTTGKFEIVATGTVDADGLLIRSDPGDGIDLSGWGCNCPPYSVTSNCCHSPGGGGRGGPVCCIPDCGLCQTCQDGACVPAGDGASCGQCKQCFSGGCISTGVACDSNCCEVGQECCFGTCHAEGTECCAELCEGLCDECVNHGCVSICGPCQKCATGGGSCEACDPCCSGVCTDEGSECCDPGECSGECDQCVNHECISICGACQKCEGGACISCEVDEGELCCEGVCSVASQCCTNQVDCGACEACENGACVDAGCGDCACTNGICFCEDICEKCVDGACVDAGCGDCLCSVGGTCFCGPGEQCQNGSCVPGI